MKKPKIEPLSRSQSSGSARRKNFCELSLSLVFSFWCLLFLFYSRFGRGQSNQDSYHGDDGNNYGWSEMLLDSNISTTGSTKNSTVLRTQQQMIGKNASLSGCSEGNSSSGHGTCPSQKPHQHNNSYSCTGEKAISGSMQTSLVENKNKSAQGKQKGASGPLGNFVHRLEPGGKEYNYALADKGAKVLAHNKEAKGAVNIISTDRDKYLRNPCSAEGKFVVIELSEETLVDVVEMANLEHYSSNFKEFELWGSLAYPTEEWIPLGSFVADNVKHSQRFMLTEPKWVRYMKLKLISHYGVEFYCTLSYLQVYGVDAIERMLEDFIIVPDIPTQAEKMSAPSKTETVSDDMREGLPTVGEAEDQKVDTSSNNVLQPAKEVRQQPTGRIASDSVLKILMQKLRSLELNLSVLSEYSKQLNASCVSAIPGFSEELSRKALLLEKVKMDLSDLFNWRSTLEKEMKDLDSWKLRVSTQMNAMLNDNELIRAHLEKVLANHDSMERKEMAVLAVSLFFSCIALFKVLTGIAVTLFRGAKSSVGRTNQDWLFIFVSSTLTTFIALVYS